MSGFGEAADPGRPTLCLWTSLARSRTLGSLRTPRLGATSSARALIDPELHAQHNEIHDALHQACDSALKELAAAGRAQVGPRTAVQVERLHALTDGLAVHTALPPDLMTPERIIAVLRLHLDALDGEPDPKAPTASI